MRDCRSAARATRIRLHRAGRQAKKKPGSGRAGSGRGVGGLLVGQDLLAEGDVELGLARPVLVTRLQVAVLEVLHAERQRQRLGLGLERPKGLRSGIRAKASTMSGIRL